MESGRVGQTLEKLAQSLVVVSDSHASLAAAVTSLTKNMEAMELRVSQWKEETDVKMDMFIETNAEIMSKFSIMENRLKGIEKRAASITEKKG